jgi:hypothetical protein
MEKIPLCIRRAINDGAMITLNTSSAYILSGRGDAEDIWKYYCEFSKDQLYLANLIESNKPICDYALDFLDFSLQLTTTPMYFCYFLADHKIDRGIMQRIFDSGFAGLDLLKLSPHYADMNLDLRSALRKTSYAVINHMTDAELQSLICISDENIAAIADNENMCDIDMFLFIRRLNLSALWHDAISRTRPITKLLLDFNDRMPTIHHIGEILRMAAASHHTLYDTKHIGAEDINKYRRAFLSKGEEFHLRKYESRACCVHDYNLLGAARCSIRTLFAAIFPGNINIRLYKQILTYVARHYPQYYMHFDNSSAEFCAIYEKRIAKHPCNPSESKDILEYYGRSTATLKYMRYRSSFIRSDFIGTIIAATYGHVCRDTLYMFAAEFPSFNLNMCEFQSLTKIITIFGIMKVDVPHNKIIISKPLHTFADNDHDDISPHTIFETFEYIIMQSPQKLSQLWGVPILGNKFIKWFESRLQRRIRWIHYALVPIADIDMRQKIYNYVIPA